MIEEPLQPRGARGAEELPELRGGHGVAVMGRAAGVYPGDDALRVVYDGERAPRLSDDDLFEELRRERLLQVAARVDARQLQPEERPDYRQPVRVAKARVPGGQCLDPPADGPDHPVEAAV